MHTAKDLMLNTPKSFRKILRSALYANLSQVRAAPGGEGGGGPEGLGVAAVDPIVGCQGGWSGGGEQWRPRGIEAYSRV